MGSLSRRTCTIRSLKSGCLGICTHWLYMTRRSPKSSNRVYHPGSKKRSSEPRRKSDQLARCFTTVKSFAIRVSQLVSDQVFQDTYRESTFVVKVESFFTIVCSSSLE